MGSSANSDSRMTRTATAAAGRRLTFLCLALIALAAMASAAEPNARKPKLFFASVSSSTTTTTVTSTIGTASYCFTAAANAMPCDKRKKRFINEAARDKQEIAIAPNSTNSELISGLEANQEAESSRTGRFFLMFTSTSTVSVTHTTTSTQFTATLSVSLGCAPTNLNMCG